MSITIHNYSDRDIYPKTSQRLINVLSDLLMQGRKTLLLLSGGSSVNLYGYLAEYLNHSRPALLSIAQVDERFKPDQSSDINARAIKIMGIPYYIISQEGSVEKSAEEYNETIGRLWKEYDYKIAVLGIGEDCHTAGLIPGYRKLWDKQKLTIGYSLTIGQKSAYADFCPQGFKQRITVTPKLLEELDYALIVAAGEEKKEAIENALKKENLQDLNKYPAAIIQ
ncbi:6-phosphogluconolactonase, partial [Candidatus Gottesmanbacteria bacterium]|nr:6-phosphogluconolactonase [Candidatus Gottesmanbacteria bacterium]